jgi:hypothetical protein
MNEIWIKTIKEWEDQGILNDIIDGIEIPEIYEFLNKSTILNYN